MDFEIVIDNEIDRRTEQGHVLAVQFAHLRGLPYPEFLMATLDMGYDLDFITSVECHKALNHEG